MITRNSGFPASSDVSTSTMPGSLAQVHGFSSKNGFWVSLFKIHF